MNRLNLIELNEINLDVVEAYIKQSPQKLPGFEKLFLFNRFKTSSEKEYKNIEPWIQWPSVHTCKTYEEHKVFRLGDIVNCSHEQIFEKIERAGFDVGCICPMNAENRLKKPKFFIPDPWTDTKPDPSLASSAVHRAVRQAVNDNAKGSLSLSSLTALIWILLTKTQKKNWLTYAKLFKNRKKKWNKALFLDLLLSDLFINFKRNKPADFNCIFLNAFAHIQHHYFLNSTMYDGKLKNNSKYLSEDDDPILDAIVIYDKILYDLMGEKDEKYVFATGLRQVPVSVKRIYYRLRNHKKFLQNLGIKNFAVDPRMTRDFLISFDSEDDQVNAYNILSKVEHKGQKLFSEIEERVGSLFVTLTFSDEIDSSDIFVRNNQIMKLDEEFVFVAVKNGHHDELGYLLTNFTPKKFKDGEHVANLGREILYQYNIVQ